MTSSLEAVRRVDWRFLLPDSQPRTVVLLAEPEDPLLTEGLSLVGAVLVRPDAPQGADIDVVVLCDPSDESVRRADALRSPHGSVVVETTSRRARRESDRRLRRSGLRVRQYGCWPRSADATRFVPLDDRSQLLAGARAVKNRRRRVVATLLTRLGFGALVFRHATSVATAPDRPSVPGPVRVALGDAIGEAPGVMTLLTPRFGTSRHVIALVVDRLGALRVAKTPRIPGDNAQLEREVRGLTSVSGPRPDRPELVADTERFGQRWVVQTGIEGRPLTRRDVARDADRWLVAAHAWLEGMPSGEASCPDQDGRRARLLDPAFDILSRCAVRSPELRPLVADAERALRRIDGVPLPVCAEHGDFRPPNLIVTGPRSIAAVDWELAEPRGFPLYDSWFFHAFVAEVAPDVRPRFVALDAAAARRHGLDTDLIATLGTLAALRQFANSVERRTETVVGFPADAASSDIARAWFASLIFTTGESGREANP